MELCEKREAIKSILDYEEGIRNCSSEDTFWRLLKDFYNLIDVKTEKIRQCLNNHDIKTYTVEVHGMKSNARLVGLMDLSGLFYRLEHLGKENNLEAIERENDDILDYFCGYKAKLEKFVCEEEEKSPKANKQISDRKLSEMLGSLKAAIDVFDLDKADEIMSEINGYQFRNDMEDKIHGLAGFVADVDMEKIIATADELIAELNAV